LKKNVREAILVKAGLKIEAKDAEKTGDQSEVLSGDEMKMLLETVAAVSGPRKFQGTPSLRNLTRPLAWRKRQRPLGRHLPKPQHLAQVFLPTSSPSAKWRLCSSLANKN